MIKSDELKTPNSCLNKAGTDEPLFVLRAKDPLAPMTIRHWATMSERTQEPEKIQEALKLASEMEAWRNDTYGPSEGPAEPKLAARTPR